MEIDSIRVIEGRQNWVIAKVRGLEIILELDSGFPAEVQSQKKILSE
jgi:hypothetical protein